MNADDDDPDWELEAKKAESSEQLNAILARIAASHRLDVKRLQIGTRLVVSLVEGAPVEFTILDPASRKVLVKDESNFRKLTEGTLQSPLRQIGGLSYAVGGKEFYGDAVGSWGIKRIQIFMPGRTEPYDLWSD